MADQTRGPKRIALTGGPGAGKTAVLELVHRLLCHHVRVLPESASIVFRGGFPRGPTDAVRRAEQRAIFFVQRELEATAEDDGLAIVLCDRGTVDGAAYWPGPGELWSSVGTTLDEQLARYHAVIHLRTPIRGYNHTNPLRIESVAEARAIDDRIAQLWARHPRRFEVPAETDFLTKAAHAIQLLRDELPPGCLEHLPTFHRPHPALHVHQHTHE
ncbi:MAG TPA: ATP-binding protein [Kofleriaceae bacterium]|nr:ATP-binding protein [Kofleriaceae bacterium]